jgi:hypothetical protein
MVGKKAKAGLSAGWSKNQLTGYSLGDREQLSHFATSVLTPTPTHTQREGGGRMLTTQCTRCEALDGLAERLNGRSSE